MPIKLKPKAALVSKSIKTQAVPEHNALKSDLLTVRQAAEIARVTHQTIRRWIRSEGLPAYRGRGRIRICKLELIKFLKGEA